MPARSATWLTVLALTCSASQVAAQRSAPAGSAGGGSTVAPTTPATAPAATPASAPSDDEARVHFRLGTAYYDSGRFAQAAEEFKQAHELSQRPQLLYNLFLAYRDAGDLVHAA